MSGQPSSTEMIDMLPKLCNPNNSPKDEGWILSKKIFDVDESNTWKMAWAANGAEVAQWSPMGIRMEKYSETTIQSQDGKPVKHYTIGLRLQKTNDTTISYGRIKFLTFDVQKGDKIARTSQYLGKVRDEDEMCVWHARHATEMEGMLVTRKLKMEMGFVKHVYDANNNELKAYPLVQLETAAMNALGVCFDYLIDGKLPRPSRLSRTAEGMAFIANTLIDYQNHVAKLKFRTDPSWSSEGSKQDEPLKECEAGQYCKLGAGVTMCPESACLPCNRDPDGTENGLKCVECQLNSEESERTSAPTCTACADQDFEVRLRDASGFRWRAFCRTPAVVPGEIPGLCAAAVQGGKITGSEGEIWRLKAGSDKYSQHHARLQTIGKNRDGSIQVYLMLFKDEQSLTTESRNHWAGAMMSADYALQFPVYTNLTIADGHRGEKSTGLFRIIHAHKYSLARRTARNRWEVDLAFAKQVRDVQSDAKVDQPPVLRLSEAALQALGVCLDYIKTGELHDTSNLYLGVMKVASTAGVMNVADRI